MCAVEQQHQNHRLSFGVLDLINYSEDEMDTATPAYRSEVLKELEQIPAEFLPAFLKVIRAFREGVTLSTAEESFRQGWQDALTGQTHPISELWEDINAE